MGVQIAEIVSKKTIELEDLTTRTIAIDAYNSLYQFLSIIRQPDGTPLMDTKGRITSHLSGLFYRTTKLLGIGIMPVHVFDGKPPDFKGETLEQRKQIKIKAEQRLEDAIKHGNIEEARKAAQATSRLTKEMVEESKHLLDLMGLPYIQAPSEAEAQAAYMTKQNDVWATGSQDYDSLMFGSPRLIRNLSITGRRKLPRKQTHIEIKPELMELKDILNELKITQEQLIVLGILVGSDFNMGGVKGIGPKKALQIVQSKSIKDIFNEEDFGSHDPQLVLDFFFNPPIEKNYEIKWGKPDNAGIKKMMVDEFSFSEERVDKVLETLKKSSGHNQKNLGSWF